MCGCACAYYLSDNNINSFTITNDKLYIIEWSTIHYLYK